MCAIDFVVEILRSQFSGDFPFGVIGAATLAELGMRGCSFPFRLLCQHKLTPALFL